MVDISVIVPIFNGEKWIDQCFNSIVAQTVFKHTELKIEVVVYNDGSNDNTSEILKRWQTYFGNHNIIYNIVTNPAESKGVGAAKNGAIAKSTGSYLCFQDIDDIMVPDRIILQWSVARVSPETLVGSKIVREPVDSTPRFVKWANSLNSKQLKTQIYTSNGPTLLMPTWFCHRSVYLKVGKFHETNQGTPEDLIFFYEHIDRGGKLHRVDEVLVIYTYHKDATTFSISRQRILDIQLQRLEKNVLSQWSQFSIWNAGKRGRKIVRSLSLESLKKVVAFCDVDPKKIGRSIELYSPMKRAVIAKLPVVHFSEAIPPLLVCVKLDLTKGEFEKNLNSLNLIEGVDYVLFS